MTENEIILEKQIADDLSAVLKEAKAMGCREVACFRHIPLQNVEAVIQALEEIQQYRAIENELKEKYQANVDIPLLMKYFIDTVFEGEKHEGFCILTNEDRAMWDAYKELGTVEDIQQKLAELERWHATEVNPKIKNVFANTSTQICHNCDHKDEYIEELEAEIEELQALKEKAEPKKPLGRDEKHKFFGCPVCKHIVSSVQNYCEDCGQKLDWSE